MLTLIAIGKKLDDLGQKLAEKTSIGRTQRKTVRHLRLLVTLVVGIVIFILFPAITFSKVEHWSYHEAIYFVFTSLTTVGFGDLVLSKSNNTTFSLPILLPSNHGNIYFNYNVSTLKIEYYSGGQSVIYKISRPLWLIFGFTWMALLVVGFVENVKRLRERDDQEQIILTPVCI